jgi:NCS1 family nucleobase:cation symporter-1
LNETAASRHHDTHHVTGPLSNADLAPVPSHKQDWDAMCFFVLWVGMAVNIPTYMIASSLVDGGMSWQQAMWTVLLGNLIVLVPMALSGHAGTKYGIPFPVFARASFGIKGAHIPSFLRAIVACGWFGIQTWIGGAAIYTILLIYVPGVAETPALMPDWIGIHWAQFACFMVFWCIAEAHHAAAHRDGTGHQPDGFPIFKLHPSHCQPQDGFVAVRCPAVKTFLVYP